MDDVFEFGRRLQADGHLAEAEKCYRRLLEDDPNSVKVLNNLGTVLDSQGKLPEALQALMQARDLKPDEPLVRYNLAQVLYRQDRLDPAAEQFGEALRIDPDMCDARLNLAVVRWRQNDLDAAEAALRENLKRDPDHIVSRSRLGFLLFDLGRMAEAYDCHAAVLERYPEDAEEHFYAGRALSSLGRFSEAADAHARSQAIMPGERNVHEHRVRALRAAHRFDEIEDAFTDWLTALPCDPVATHLRAAFFSDDAPARASDDYVRQEFDGFAVDYQETLAKLGYRGPELMHQAVEGTLGTGSADLRALDAGCGTGLCGAWIGAYARQLIGVDLSPGMLAQARDNQAYDELIEAELSEYLGSLSDPFDLIVAADTLIYFGEMGALMRTIFAALAPGGLIAFTAEDAGDLPERGFQLQPHGRYAHSEAYLRDSMTAAGLTDIAVDRGVVRTEGAQPVTALIVTGRRPA